MAYHEHKKSVYTTLVCDRIAYQEFRVVKNVAPSKFITLYLVRHAFIYRICNLPIWIQVAKNIRRDVSAGRRDVVSALYEGPWHVQLRGEAKLLFFLGDSYNWVRCPPAKRNEFQLSDRAMVCC